MKKSNYAVIIVDMVEDFVHGPLKSDRVNRIIPNIVKLLAYARKHGWVVAYSGDAHFPEDPEIALWGAHAVQGTPGAKIIAEIEPQKDDYVLPKRTYSAFHETGMDLLLREKGVDTVIVIGLHTHICVRHTCADAYIRNYSIIVPEDCVEAFNDADHNNGLAYLKMCYAAKIVKTRDLTK